MKEATSQGAALTGFAALEGVDPRGLADKVRITYEEVAPMAGLAARGAYQEDWMRLAGEEDRGADRGINQVARSAKLAKRHME